MLEDKISNARYNDPILNPERKEAEAMGKAKRCRAVVLGASVAALGAAGACPATSAASTQPTTRSRQGVVAPVHRKRRHRKAVPQARVHHGPYLYEVLVGGEVRLEKPNAACMGSSIKFTGVTLKMPESALARALASRNEAAFWGRRATITAGPASTITMPWSSAQETREAEENGGMVPHPRNVWASAPAARICAATAPNGALGSIGEGVVTWRLAQPVNTLSSLLAHAPAVAVFNELMVSFAIQPDGSVPAFPAA